MGKGKLCECGLLCVFVRNEENITVFLEDYFLTCSDNLFGPTKKL